MLIKSGPHPLHLFLNNIFSVICNFPFFFFQRITDQEFVMPHAIVIPCDIYEERLMNIAKELILTTKLSIAEIARQLTFDPSNFSKFFKHFAGITPKQFRDAHAG